MTTTPVIETPTRDEPVGTPEQPKLEGIPSEQLQEDAKKTVEEFIDSSKGVREEHLKNLDNIDKHYRVKQGNSHYQGRAKTANGITHEVIETIVALLFDILTDNGQLPYEVGSVDTEMDTILVNGAINPLITHELKHMKARKRLVEALRVVVKDGTVVSRLRWKVDTLTRNAPQYQQTVIGQTPEGIPIIESKLLGYEKVETPISAGMEWEILDLKSAWLDPYEADVDKAAGIAEEMLVPLEFLEKEELRQAQEPMQDPQTGMSYIVQSVTGHYFNLDKVREKIKTSTEKLDKTGETQEHQNKKHVRPMVKIIPWSGWFDYNGDGKEEDCIITLATDDHIVIQCEPSTVPSRPYNVSRYLPLLGRTYGLGVGEIVSTQHEVVDDITNQILDNVTVNLLNMSKVKKGSSTEEQDLEFKPWGKIFVDEMDDIEPLTVTDMTSSGWAGIAFLLDQIRNSVAATKTLQGMAQQYHTTATEINQMVTQSFTRHILTAIVLEMELVIPVIKKTIEYEHEFGSVEALVRITNNPEAAQLFFQLPLEQIIAQYDFTPLGATNFQRLQKLQQQYMQLLQFLQGVAPLVDPMAAITLGVNTPKLVEGVGGTMQLPHSEQIFMDGAEIAKLPWVQMAFQMLMMRETAGDQIKAEGQKEKNESKPKPKAKSAAK